MNEEFIGNRIAGLRKNMNISARKLSLTLNQNENYISKIEAHKMLPSIPALFSICDVFNISVSNFFNDGKSEVEKPMIANNEKSEIEKLLLLADRETKELVLGILKKIIKYS